MNGDGAPDAGSAADSLTVLVTGAGGRMGEAVVRAAVGRDLSAVAVDRSLDESVAGVPVHDDADLAAVVRETDADVVVDFTAPAATVRYARSCADAGVPLVTGTTGLDAEHEAVLAEAAASIPVLHASNFSRGVAALRRAVRAAVRATPGYDVEVTETHHNGKRDAPSGTANTILADVEEERDDLTERVHGREGEAPRTPGEVGVHARRAGDVTGEHEVLLAGNRETLSLTHRAGDRGVFAEGALDAANWLAGQAPGRYDFSEVLE